MGPRQPGYGRQGKPGGSNNSGMAQEKGGPPSSQFSNESSSRDRKKQTPLLGQGHQSWDPDDRGMAGKGSQEVVITLVWLRRKGVHPLLSLVMNQVLGIDP